MNETDASTRVRGAAGDTKAMTVRLSADQAQELEKIAQIDDVPIAEAVRAAIAEHISSRRKDREFQRRVREIIDQDRAILERLID
jgi:hypothetical protein